MKKITLLAMSFVMALTVKAQRGTDVTNLLTNPDFESDATGWTIVGGNKIAATAANYGYNATKFIENWVAAPETLGDQSWSQTIEVPNGVYVVRSLAHAVLQSDDSLVPSGVAIYANQDMVPVTTTNTNPPTEYSVATIVTDGKLKVEYRISSCNVNWAAWDNVRLMQYVGETLEDAKYVWILDELNSLGEKALALTESKMQESIVDAIEETVAGIADITTYEAGAALLETLKEQVAAAELSIEAYVKLAAALDAANYELDRGFSMGLDEFYDAIDAAQAAYEAAELGVEEVEAVILKLREDIETFQMANADGTERFDVTEKYMTNPTLRKGNQGWSGSVPSLQHEVMEFFNSDFDMYQTVTGLPNGLYAVQVQGFYRASTNNDNVGSDAYLNGTEVITAELYANDASAPLMSLYKHTAEEMGITVDVYNGYINMRNSVNMAFNLTNPETGNLYYTENEVLAIVQDGTLKLGLRNTGHSSDSWCAFRDFKLYYYGNFPAVALAVKLEEANEWLAERAEILPATAYNELSDACLDAEGYTEIRAYENEEVIAAMAAFEAVFNSVKNVEVLVAQLQELIAKVENMITLEYPGVNDLNEAYDVVTPLVEDGAEVELAEDQTTEQYYQEAVAALKAAIRTYHVQDVVGEEPLDYTHLITLPNFSDTKDYTIPAPWVVANVQKGGDVWVGPGQPDAAGDGTNLPCLNSWSNDFTSMDVHQDLDLLGNGIYSLSAQAITQGLGQQHAYAIGSMNTVVSEDMTVVGWDTNEWETLETDKVIVLDGKLRIGFASVSAGGVNGWYQVTNFKLKYYGPAEGENLKGIWESTLARAKEFVNILLPGDSKGVQAAIEAATPLADAGEYLDAYTTLKSEIDASDSIFKAVQRFYAGNYETLLDMTAELDYDVNISSAKLLAVTMQMVGQALHAEDATHSILPALDAKLGGYVAYATALIEAENTLATIKGVKAEDIAFVKEQVITPQVEDLTAVLRPAADCADLQAKLEKAMKRLTSALNINLRVGDLTEDLVVNPTIDDEAATGWTVVKGTGNGSTNASQHYDGTSANRYLDSWAASGLNFTAYQEIIGLPDGAYQLTVATRSDGDNAWVFASPEVFPADTLTADTAKWAEATQWAMVKNNGNTHGEIWYADSLAWVAADEAIVAPYFNANNGQGWGWSYDTITVEVTRHYLAIGMTANSELSRKDKFTGTWMSVDDWKLELLTKAATQSPFDVTDGIENVEAVVPVKLGIYDLFGRRIDTPTASGIYIIDGKKTLIKK